MGWRDVIVANARIRNLAPRPSLLDGRFRERAARDLRFRGGDANDGAPQRVLRSDPASARRDNRAAIAAARAAIGSSAAKESVAIGGDCAARRQDERRLVFERREFRGERLKRLPVQPAGWRRERERSARRLAAARAKRRNLAAASSRDRRRRGRLRHRPPRTPLSAVRISARAVGR